MSRTPVAIDLVATSAEAASPSACRKSSNLGAVVVLAGIALVLTGPACSRDRAEEPPGHSPEPRLELEATEVKLKRLVEGERQHLTVPFGNAGQRTLQILRVDRSRFCRVDSLPAALGPGEQGQLQVECLADLHGPIKERIKIHSNDPQHPEFDLTLTGRVEPQLAFEPQSVSLELAYGEHRSREVLLRGIQLGAAKIELHRGSLDDVSQVEPLLNDDGKLRGYRITCTGAKVGLHASSLLVSTGLSRPKELSLSYACRVRGTLDVSPSAPYFDLRVSGAKEKEIRVRSRQPAFVVRSVEILGGPFEAELLSRDTDGSFPIRVRVLDQQLGPEARSATGTLLIVSNDITQPRREVRLLGFGHVNRAARSAAGPLATTKEPGGPC